MKFRKIFTAVTAAVMCLTISSCGGNGNEQVPETAAETTADGKKTIKMTVMGSSVDTNFQFRIAEFNSTSEEYEIEVTDRGTNDLANDIDTINLEIIAGNTPDILEGFFMPIKSYAEKGLLANYYDFIDNDPEMSRDDFLENVFKACEINGGLYENITTFSIEAFMGKASIVGEIQGRTSDDFIDLAEKYPDKKFIDMPMSKSFIFEEFMRYGWQSFVDNETGKCNFNSEKFIRILEFCDTFPKEYDYSYLKDQNYRKNEAEDLRNEKTLFTVWSRFIFDFYDLRKLEYNTLGEPPAIVGYPDAEGNGALINAYGSFIVFENSPVKEGVWEYLRNDYLDEYQKDIILHSDVFPVKKSALEFAAEDAKKGYYLSYADEYSDEFGINTDEDNQRILDLINGATCRVDNSENFVYNIIQEEAEMYFSGQRPVKETAEIIQNRVQNYLDENR